MFSQPEFNTLTLVEQAAYLNTKGTYLAIRFEDGYVIHLFHLNSFFAEAWHVIRDNYLREITTFTGARCLDPYTEAIHLPM